MSGIQELEPNERRQARAIAQRVYRDRRISPKDRQVLGQLARKVGKGAVRGVRGGGLTGLRRRR